MRDDEQRGTKRQRHRSAEQKPLSLILRRLELDQYTDTLKANGVSRVTDAIRRGNDGLLALGLREWHASRVVSACNSFVEQKQLHEGEEDLCEDLWSVLYVLDLLDYSDALATGGVCSVADVIRKQQEGLMALDVVKPQARRIVAACRSHHAPSSPSSSSNPRSRSSSIASASGAEWKDVNTEMQHSLDEQGADQAEGIVLRPTYVTTQQSPFVEVTLSTTFDSNTFEPWYKLLPTRQGWRTHSTAESTGFIQWFNSIQQHSMDSNPA